MNNCMYSNCPHFGKTSCTFTAIGGTWKCTRELKGKTITVSASTIDEMVHTGAKINE